MSPAQIMTLLNVHAWINETDERKRERMRDGRSYQVGNKVVVNDRNADMVFAHLSSMKLKAR